MSAAHQRPKLTASQQAVHALIRRRHEEKLQVLRRQVEADPGCGLTNHLGKVENRLHAGDLAGAGNAMIDIERALAERAEQVAISAAISQTVGLAASRDEVIDEKAAGSANVRILSRDGLLWLKAKRRLSSSELMALEHYRALYEKAHRGPVGSSLGAQGRGGSEASPFYTVSAVTELAKARDAVGHETGLVRLLDEVAGRGTTIRELSKGDRHVGDRLEVELRVAARLLAKAFGYAG